MCDDNDDDDDCLVVYADLDLPQCNSTPKQPDIPAEDIRTPYSTIDFNKRPPSPILEVAEDENANEVVESGNQASGATVEVTPSSEEEYQQKNPHTVIV